MSRNQGRLGRSALAVMVAVALTASACSSTGGASPTVDEIASTGSGAVRGFADGDVLRFSGIPYAAPPVGELRWSAPAEVDPWEGTLDATDSAARCPQGVGQVGAPAETPASADEDCLTLSITAPAGVAEGDLPVIVWIHGGGFATGSGNDYDPSALSRDGAVVVTVNYRLGLLGFLGLPGLEAGGGFGLLDQQAALRWVHEEITAFGGDPERVTIAGDSAGADSVCAQLASPDAAGLFQGAIMMSPGCGQINVTDAIAPGLGAAADTWKPRELSDGIGAAFAASVGCSDPATAIDCLRAMDVDALLEANAAAPIPTFWSPAYGTEVLPQRPSDAIADGQHHDVPVLLSMTQDEGAFFVGPIFGASPLDDTTLTQLLALAAPSDAAGASIAYRSEGATPNRVWASVVSDRAFACPIVDAAVGLGEHDDAYLAEFADSSAPNVLSTLPADLAGTATHGSDVPYLLALDPGQPMLSADQQAAGEQMRAAWIAFAATGDPSTPDHPWPTVDEGATSIDASGLSTTDVEDLVGRHHCDLW